MSLVTNTHQVATLRPVHAREQPIRNTSPALTNVYGLPQASCSGCNMWRTSRDPGYARARGLSATPLSWNGMRTTRCQLTRAFRIAPHAIVPDVRRVWRPSQRYGEAGTANDVEKTRPLQRAAREAWPRLRSEVANLTPRTLTFLGVCQVCYVRQQCRQRRVSWSNQRFPDRASASRRTVYLRRSRVDNVVRHDRRSQRVAHTA